MIGEGLERISTIVEKKSSKPHNNAVCYFTRSDYIALGKLLPLDSLD